MRISDWSSDVCSSDLSALEILLSPPFTSIEVASFMRFTVTGSVNGMPPPKGLFANLRLLPAGAGAGDQAKALPRRSEERRVGKRLAVRVDLGGRRIIKKKKK